MRSSFFFALVFVSQLSTVHESTRGLSRPYWTRDSLVTSATRASAFRTSSGWKAVESLVVSTSSGLA